MLKTINLQDLAVVTGGGNLPFGGNVNQQINTNWGGTQVINPPIKPPTTVLEYWKLHPELRMGSPRPIGR
jgi:hypothetical protein